MPFFHSKFTFLSSNLVFTIQNNGTQDDSASGQFLEKKKKLPILSLLVLFLS